MHEPNLLDVVDTDADDDGERYTVMGAVALAGDFQGDAEHGAFLGG